MHAQSSISRITRFALELRKICLHIKTLKTNSNVSTIGDNYANRLLYTRPVYAKDFVCLECICNQIVHHSQKEAEEDDVWPESCQLVLHFVPHKVGDDRLQHEADTEGNLDDTPNGGPVTRTDDFHHYHINNRYMKFRGGGRALNVGVEVIDITVTTIDAHFSNRQNKIVLAHWSKHLNSYPFINCSSGCREPTCFKQPGEIYYDHVPVWQQTQPLPSQVNIAHKLEYYLKDIVLFWHLCSNQVRSLYFRLFHYALMIIDKFVLCLKCKSYRC